MPCETNVLGEFFIKNLPETIQVSPVDKFVVELASGGTSTISFEEFNLDITNTLFEDEFNSYTTRIDELSSYVSPEGGITIDAINGAKSNIDGKFDELLVKATSLTISAQYYEDQIISLLNSFNPDSSGVIQKLDIEQQVIFSDDGVSLSGNHYRITNKYVNHSERTDDNFLDVTELVPEKSYTGSGGNGIDSFFAQSAGIYVEVKDSTITLSPTPKAQGMPIECLTIVLSNINLFEGEEDIIDIVKSGTDSTLITGDAFRGTLNDELVDVLDFSYVVDSDNSTISITYKNTGNPGEVRISDSPDAVEVFNLRMDDKSTIVTTDSKGVVDVPDPASVGDTFDRTSSYPGASFAIPNNSGIAYKESIAVADAGDLVVAAGRGSLPAITIWSITNGELVDSQLIDTPSWISGISFRRNILAVGQSGSNSVIIYERGSNNQFTQTQTMKGGVGFGASVYLNQDETLITIGTRQADIQTRGAVDVYNLSTGAKVGDTLLNDHPVNASGRDYGFGHAVCLDNNRLVVGGGSESYGSVFAYDWDGILWNKVFTLADAVGPDKTGYDIELNTTASRLVITESQANNGDGLARAYTWNGSNYIPSGIFTPPVGSASYMEAVTISGNGNKVAIGQGLWSEGGESNTGRIVVFDFPFTKTHEFFGPELSRLMVCDFDNSGNILVAGCPGSGDIILYELN